MTNRTVTEYFEHRLNELGYDFSENNVYWGLSYSQGDGMDFAGTVSNDGIIRLYSRLMGTITERKNERLWNALCSGMVSIDVRHIQSMYHHWNTMAVDFEYDADALRSEYGFTKDQLERIEDFHVAVVADVITTSKTLTAEGYKLLEACNPIWFLLRKGWVQDYIGDRSAMTRTFHRGDFTITVSMVENDHLDGYSSGDDLEDHQDIMRMIAGEVVSYDVRLRILSDGNPVFEEWSHGVSDQRGKLSAISIGRELLSGARPVLREKAEKLIRFAGSTLSASSEARTAHQMR
jgi:hypothetical protein